MLKRLASQLRMWQQTAVQNMLIKSGCQSVCKLSGTSEINVDNTN